MESTNQHIQEVQYTSNRMNSKGYTTEHIRIKLERKTNSLETSKRIMDKMDSQYD